MSPLAEVEIIDDSTKGTCEEFFSDSDEEEEEGLEGIESVSWDEVF